MPARAPLALLALALLAAAPAAAESPRIAFVEWREGAPSTQLATVAADGSGRRALRLTGARPLASEGPAWSADGSTLLFSGYYADAAGNPRGGAVPRLFAISGDGGEARALPGTEGALHPVLSRDGSRVAFKRIRYKHRYDPRNPLDFGADLQATAWIAPLAGGPPRRLTPWKRGLVNAPASFSPDGSVLLLERDRRPGWHPEVVALDLATGSTRVIARAAEDPAFSPDGLQLAMVNYRDGHELPTALGPEPVGELYVTAADGTRPRRLTPRPAPRSCSRVGIPRAPASPSSAPAAPAASASAASSSQAPPTAPACVASRAPPAAVPRFSSGRPGGPARRAPRRISAEAPAIPSPDRGRCTL